MKPPTPKEQFSDLTAIIPSVIAQMCMDERGHAHDQCFIEHVDLRTRWMHVNNLRWRKFLESEDGRDQLYIWVNHWLNGYMQDPELYRKWHPA